MAKVKQGSQSADTRKKLSKRKRSVFLKCLAETGKVGESARAAGYLSTETLRSFRKNDEDFAEAWDLATSAAGDLLEEEAIRRAVDGTLKPVFYKGEIVGQEIQYSDSLMAILLKANNPSKYNRSGGETNVNVRFGVAVLPMTAVNADDWEKGAIEMHEGQEFFDVVDLDVDTTVRPLSVKRGD